MNESLPRLPTFAASSVANRTLPLMYIVKELDLVKLLIAKKLWAGFTSNVFFA